MASTLLCDGCGIDMQFLDKVTVTEATLERGNLNADLCPNCAQDIWQTPVGQKLRELQAAERAAKEAIFKQREAELLMEQALQAQVATQEATNGDPVPEG